jgi:hypothetical protein
VTGQNPGDVGKNVPGLFDVTDLLLENVDAWSSDTGPRRMGSRSSMS